MSSSSSESDSETEITLYNPSADEAEEVDPASLDDNVIDIEIDRELAERLLEVSKHLGLNPTIIASRAIDLVCEEIGTLDEDWQEEEGEFGTVTLIQRYQARVDLHQVLKEETEDPPDTSGPEPEQPESPASPDASEEEVREERKLWEAVDEIKEALDDEEEMDVRDGLKVDEAPPTLEFTVDESVMREGTLEQSESENDDADSEDWDAVESIIEAGERAKR